MEFKKSVIELISERKSQRTYKSKEFPIEIINRIFDLLDGHKNGPMGNHIDFHLIQKKFDQENKKVKIGTYGFISGAQYFIAGEITENNYCFEDYGYILEKIILHLTEWQLGTCWLGGTFNRKVLYGALNSDRDALIPAITPVGYPADSKTIRENIIRWAAKSDSRMEWNNLFFNEAFSRPLSRIDADSYALPLEMIRLAPSASNKQPWRIVKDPAGFHFYLKRTKNYKKMFAIIDLQKIDIGIAMAHFELSCLELHLTGKWKSIEHEVESKIDEEYIVSWIV